MLLQLSNQTKSISLLRPLTPAARRTTARPSREPAAKTLSLSAMLKVKVLHISADFHGKLIKMALSMWKGMSGLAIGAQVSPGGVHFFFYPNNHTLPTTCRSCSYHHSTKLV